MSSPEQFNNTPDKQPSLCRRVGDWYFSPRPFELKRPNIYEQLGVRMYKRYLPTGGDLILQRVFRESVIKPGTDSRETSINWLLYFTEKVEIIHLISFTIITLGLPSITHDYGIPVGLPYLAINIAVNLYPIFVQRYNRARMTQILDRINRQRDNNQHYLPRQEE